MFENKRNRKDSHVLRTLLVFFICLFIGLCAVLAVRLLTLRMDERINTRSIVFDEDAEDTKPEVSHAPKTLIPCWDSMTFKANTIDQDVHFYNPSLNEGINFKIKLMIDNKTIYESDLIAPGKMIKHIKISSPMTPQTVPAYILYECYTDDGLSLNGSKMNFTLKVEE